MNWKGFDPTPYTREQWAAHVAATDFSGWSKVYQAHGRKLVGITLHNTYSPTLKQWVEAGPAHDARLRNLEQFYETKGWHAGPHAFVSRSHINGFSKLNEPGVHSTCFNKDHLGIEMAGDFATEPFDTGDGAMVRDMAVFALAVLFKKLGLDPAKDLTFHRDCPQDHHACPGKFVSKPDVIARVQAQMKTL